MNTFFEDKNRRNVIIESLSNQNIVWKFIPLHAPHFRGLWEAAVRGFKHYMRRVIGDTLFTFEEFNTFVIEIEDILNSRPLVPLSDDPNDFAALTPAHFLIGSSLSSIVEQDVSNITTNKLFNWQHISKVKQNFWKRWHKEYLNELQQHTKWYKGTKQEPKLGTLVLIKEDNPHYNGALDE